jgi:hypothetical protein
MQARALTIMTLLALATAGPADQVHAADSESGRNALQSIDHGILPGGRIVIRATFARPIERLPGLFRTYHPRVSIALDFPGMKDAISDDRRNLTFRGVRNIRVLQSGDLTRVVIHLDQPLIHEMAVMGRELWLKLTPFESQREKRADWYLHAAP